MAKTSPVKELELQPDAWERFERAVKVMANSPPQHRVAKKKMAKKSVAKKGPENEPDPRSLSL
jgi:hypothetical protein